MADPIRQLLSQTSYVADGVMTVWNFSFSGGYLDKSHVKAKYLDSSYVLHDIPVTLEMFTGPYQLNITPAVGSGFELTIYRSTPKDLPLVDFADRAALTEVSLDLNAKQAIFVAAESSDALVTTLASTSKIYESTAAAIHAAQQGAASAESALSSLNDYKGRNYGSLPSDPTADPFGNPPTVGDEYFNSTVGNKRVYRAVGWLDYELSSQVAASSAMSSSEQALAQALIATTERVLAESARDSINTTGKVFTNVEGTSAGIAATTSGQQFAVLSSDLLTYDIWRNNSGVALKLSSNYTKNFFDSVFTKEAGGEWAAMWLDAFRRLAIGIDRSGETYLRLRTDAEIGGSSPELLSNRLVASGIGQLLQAIAGVISIPSGVIIKDSKLEVFANEDYSIVALDANRKAGDLAYGRDGLLKDEVITRITGRLNPDNLSPSFLSRLRSSTSYTVQITGSTPSRSLYVDDGEGTRRLITASGDPHDAYIVSTGHVFWTDSSGIQQYAPCTGGTAYPVLPDNAGVSYGDSLTNSQGTNWPGLIGTALGIPWVNAGIGGQASSDIVLRQGGLVPTVALTGGSIPASGPVALTISPLDAWRNSSGPGSFSFTGTIGGIAGTLSHDYGTNIWTFTRTVAGSSTVVANGTPFLIGTPTYDTRIQTLFFGYNNQYSSGTRYVAIRDYASAIANIKTYVKRYIVFGLVNSATETIGSDGLADVLAINAALADTYGVRYFDYRTWLINDGLSAAGITPTAQDTTDISNGIVPTSLRIAADPVHLVPAGYAAIAVKVRSIMTNLGWI